MLTTTMITNADPMYMGQEKFEPSPVGTTVVASSPGRIRRAFFKLSPGCLNWPQYQDAACYQKG